jgi:hypothetical protein
VSPLEGCRLKILLFRSIPNRPYLYEGRICDSKPYLIKIRYFDDFEQYLSVFNKEYKDLLRNVLDMFPDIKWRLKINQRPEN